MVVLDVVAAILPHSRSEIARRINEMFYARVLSSTVPHTVVIIAPDHDAVLGDYGIAGLGGDWFERLDTELATCISSASEVGLAPSSLFSDYSLLYHAKMVKKYISPNTLIVPVYAPYVSRYYEERLGRAIARCAISSGKRVLVIATTDMTHYDDSGRGAKNDIDAIEMLLELEPEEFLDSVEENNLSWCGPAAAASATYYAKEIGARRGELGTYVYEKIGDTYNGYGIIYF